MIIAFNNGSTAGNVATDVSSANPLPVTGSGGGGEVSTNLNQIDGQDVVTGGVNGTLGVGGVAAAGTAIASAGKPILVAGTDGANSRAVLTGTDGRLSVNLAQAAGAALAAAPAGTVPVYDAAVLAALGAPLRASGLVVRASASFTREANTTAYAAGDVISSGAAVAVPNNALAVGRINGGTGYITGLRVAMNDKSKTPSIIVQLYNAADATISGDNLPGRSPLYVDESKYIATVSLPAMTTGADATNATESATEVNDIRIPFVCAAGTTNVWAVVLAGSAFTPISASQFTITARVEQY